MNDLDAIRTAVVALTAATAALSGILERHGVSTDEQVATATS